MFEEKDNFEIDFSDSSVTDEKFSDYEFESCRFKNLKLEKVVFRDCVFIDCLFENCNFSEVDFENSTLTNAVFKESKILGIDYSRLNQIVDLKFENCDLSYSNFANLSLPDLVIKNSLAKNIDFSGAKLIGVNFEGSNLAESIFSHTDLSKANFKSVTNFIIDPRISNLNQATFELHNVEGLLLPLGIKLN